MILAVDSSALALLVNPVANPPHDPATQKPLLNARERIELLIKGLTAADTLIIPTPVLAETLVRAGEGGPGMLEALGGLARVKIRPFGERAAVETAMMTRAALLAGDKRGGSEAPWQKVKVDRQVIAIARVEGATRIYADDHNLVAFAKRLGMDAFSTWDLPLPAREENLFTAAGVAIEPPTAKDGEPQSLADLASDPAADEVMDSSSHVPRAINLDEPASEEATTQEVVSADGEQQELDVEPAAEEDKAPDEPSDTPPPANSRTLPPRSPASAHPEAPAR